MRIYLDNCCLQRPLDDQTQPRIRVEAEAVLAILASIQAGELSMLNSEALEYEVSRIPDDVRRNEVFAVLALSNERLEIDDEAEALAELFERRGIAPMDAVHLALASTAKADFFGTCDDKLLRNSQSLSNLTCKVVSILAMVSEVTK